MDFLTVFAVLPTVSDYSTRLNVLFFYMSWATLKMAHTAMWLELSGTVLVRVFFYFLPSIIFFVFDVAAPGIAASFKKQGEAGLPTGSKSSWPTSREAKIAGWAVANFVLGLSAQWMVEGVLSKTTRGPAVKATLSVPLPWTMTGQLFWGFLIREILSYAIHRWGLHYKDSIFPWLVECHKSWYHDLTNTFPLTAHYDHPFIYLLSTWLPMYLPVCILGFHTVTFLLYTLLISLEEVFVFCGYCKLPSFLLSMAARHAESHLADGKAYFGRWGYIDLLLGTLGNGEKAKKRK
ncbi:sterol desaturase family protein [Aspergillus mulundensis]|uniref:Fatty acid hydroxylase domain-containing protein n=1 Tax=Aspergillus mulundensis TaxID=1810919 RepID=A0A3D8RRC0_9EURO|nr:Uncharacterized protein DSM5745_06488 [Aspergillus mulundensis]RDW76496.1 Uncharacterized protein DSM5745_06488 [Aspergillus mulundensis]